MADKAFVVKNSLIVNTSLLVANNGKVGIGTANPDATLSVNGTANVSGAVKLANTLNVTGAAVFSNTATFSGAVTVAGGDLTVYRAGGNTGVVFLTSSGDRYLYFDGSNYTMPSANVFGGFGRLLATGDYMSVSDLWANTASKVVTTDQLNGIGAYVALTDGATITPALASGINFTVTLGGNRTLANPTGLVIGRSGYIEVIQDGTGNHTLSFGTAYKFDTGVAPTIDLAAGHKSVLAYHVRSSSIVFLSMPYYGVQ